jgi:AmmeMemoRadiSam system protein B
METLSGAGFLEDENFLALRETAMREFAEAPVREPSHAGSAYPAEVDELNEVMGHWMGGGIEPATDGLRAIAAPHVSPEGGYESYRSAYRLLSPELRDKTFVVLGTSHYSAPEKFGLTRKPYLTPYGQTRTAPDLIDELTRLAPGAVGTEDYCHAVEHSIEFQVLFLQALFGPDIRVLPILCGSYATSIYRGGKPEANEGVERFLGSLGEIAAREADKLFWVLGIDMAHIGQRYGDPFQARANDGEMLAVGGRDRDRMDRVIAGDVTGFWERVQENHDDLKWCGSSPIYTFMKVCPQMRGKVENYEQWNIDEASVVSFAGMSFR